MKKQFYIFLLISVAIISCAKKEKFQIPAQISASYLDDK